MGRSLRAGASADPAGPSSPGSSDDLTRGATALEAVINISEGRDAPWLSATAHSLACAVNLHCDPDHHRSVFTLLGEPDELEADVRRLVEDTVEAVDLSEHRGVHPRFGAVDVLPFVPLGSTPMARAVELRERTARWMGEVLDIPTFRYGPLPEGGQRTLPEVRRAAFGGLSPDFGPQRPHPTAGATAVGARDVLVAWNIWLDGVDPVRARQLAAGVRSPAVRALGLEVADAVQVSCNLIDPVHTTPADVLDAVTAGLGDRATVRRCELVGLAPARMLAAVDPRRWGELDLAEATTIEAAAAARGLTLS